MSGQRGRHFLVVWWRDVLQPGRWTRTNHDNRGLKDNTPGAWVDTNGPVWWYGTDRAWRSNGQDVAGRAAITRATNLITRIASANWYGENARTGETFPISWIDDPATLRRDGRVPGSDVLPDYLRQPSSVFWAQWVRSAVSWGMGYCLHQHDDTGQPLAGAMMLLHPSNVQAHDLDRKVWYDGAWHDVDDTGHVAGTDWRLLQLHNPLTPLDPLTGTTPGILEYHATELGLIDEMIDYARGTFTSGVPSGYLKSERPITPEQARSAKTEWDNSHGGPQRSTAVLGSSVTYEPIAISPVDAALADLKKLSLLDVANAYGVPPYLIGASVTGMTYSTVQMEMEALYTFTLRQWEVAIEETLSALLPRGSFVRITTTTPNATEEVPA